MTHELKTWPEFFFPILNNRKTFEIRKNDRNFRVGDELLLREFDPEKQEYTGNSVIRLVTYVMPGGNFGIEESMVVLSIKPISTRNKLAVEIMLLSQSLTSEIGDDDNFHALLSIVGAKIALATGDVKAMQEAITDLEYFNTRIN